LSRRWRNFFKRKTVRVSLAFFGLTLFFALTAELWANSRPIIMKYDGQWYLPALRFYHPSTFGQEGLAVTDYRRLAMDSSAKIDSLLWAPVRWDPFESNSEVERYPGPPSAQNWLGTDDRGRDVLARLLYGFRYSLGYAVGVWFISYLIGSLLGALMGFKGGWIDLLGQRVVEVFEVIPTLPLLLLLVTVFGASLSLLVVFSATFGWMMISIYMRGEVLRLRHREFVEAARSLGFSTSRIVGVHVLPNALGPILTFSPFAISGGIASLAVLDYLGFGLPPPTPSWGELLSQGQKNFQEAWWLAVFPSLALFFSVASLNLIGEGIRDAFDPRK
jgi:microcin C transport system permease protein